MGGDLSELKMPARASRQPPASEHDWLSGTAPDSREIQWRRTAETTSELTHTLPQK
jgi:hypothetical protein